MTFRYPGGAKCAGTRTASATGVTALSLFFFLASCSWQSEGLSAQSFSVALPVQALRGLPCLGSFCVPCVRRLMVQPLYCSAANAGVWGERLWCWLHLLRMTQQYHLASMAAWLSSTGISHHNLLLHIPSICLSTVNSSPCPGIAPQSLNTSSQLLRLPGDRHHCPGLEWLRQGLFSFIPFRLPKSSCFTLSLKCFPSDSENCPSVGIRPLL